MLAVVRKRNPYWRVGTYVEIFDDGVQKVRTEQQGNRLRVLGGEGIILEQKLVEPFISRVLSKGFDK